MKNSLSKQLTGFILVIGLGLGLMALRVSQSPRLTPSTLFDKTSAAAQSISGSNPLSAAHNSIQQTRERANEAYGKLPISFEANQGQTNDAVKFLARGSGYGLFLTPTEAVLTLRGHDAAPTALEHTKRQARTAVLRMKLVGANPAPTVSGLERLPGGNNYFLGSDPKKWHTNTPSYAKVKYENVYKGVD
jgi:cytoskeletal protein RodZ